MNIHRWLKESTAIERLYVTGGVLGGVGVVANLAALPNLATDVLALCAAAAFALGFVAWCHPWVRTARRHAVGRVCFPILHVLVLLFATVWARNIVAAALGLPSQDFDLTVAFVAFWLYLGVWCILIAFLTLAAGVLFLIRVFVVGTARAVLSKSSAPETYWGHVIGSLVVSLVAAQAVTGLSTYQSYAYPVIRGFAYIAEYQPAAAYPGLYPLERTRLHENGVVSFAVIKDLVVVIGTRKYEEPSEGSRSSSQPQVSRPAGQMPPACPDGA